MPSRPTVNTNVKRHNSNVKIGSPPDFSKLKTNFTANNILATLSLRDDVEGPELLCANCQNEDETVEKRCKNCMQFLCPQCAKYHQLSFGTKDHVLLSKDEFKSNGPAENAILIKCSKHNEDIKFYCDSCQKTMCTTCSILDRKQHEVASVEESASEAKRKVENLVEDVKERMETISAGIEAAATKSQDITTGEEACKSQIIMFSKQMHGEIDFYTNCMLAVTESSSTDQRKKVETFKKVLESSLSTCQTGVNFANDTLENGNDVQLLNLKWTIVSRLQNLTLVEDNITPNVGNPVQFLTSESPINDFQKSIENICSVEKVAVRPAKCQAKLLDPMVKVGKKSMMNVSYKDKADRMISSAVSKDIIEPIFSGVQVRDVDITKNNDGSHVISFVPNELGTLQFDAKINGCVSTGCSLKVAVQWELSQVHGNGCLGGDKHGHFNCMSGEGDVGTYSFRLGDTPMTSGAHRWKVEVSHELQDDQECSKGATFEVGVIEVNDEYSEVSIKSDIAKKWVYSGSARKVANVSLSLDMGKKSLGITPGRRNLHSTSKLTESFRRKIKPYEVKADSVFPFFSVNCPHCSLTLCKIYQ